MGGGGLDPKETTFKEIVPTSQLPPVPLRILTVGPEAGSSTTAGGPPMLTIDEGKKTSISFMEPVKS